MKMYVPSDFKHFTLVSLTFDILYTMLAWNKFMDEFEQQSQVHLQELDQAHGKQLDALKQSVTEIAESKPKKWCYV